MNRKKFVLDCSVPFTATTKPKDYRDIYNRYRQALKEKRDTRVGWLDMFKDLSPIEVHQLFAHFEAKRRKTHKVSAHIVFDKAMPKPDFPPIFPNRPLNLNEDGASINYKKSHTGPYVEYWQQADAEEMERLFSSGTLRPILFDAIPSDKRATYVNPVCS